MVPAVFASSDIWGKGPLLFHRHALSKVPGLINIAALPQKLRFCGNPMVYLQSAGMTPGDFKILRYAQNACAPHLRASQRGCIRFGNGFIPPSRS